MTSTRSKYLAAIALGLTLCGLGYIGWQQEQRLAGPMSTLRASAADLVGRYNAAHGTSVSVPGLAVAWDLDGPPAHLVYGGVEFDAAVVARAAPADLLRHLCHELAHHTLNSRRGAFHSDHADDGAQDFRDTFAEYLLLAGLKP